MQGVVYITPGPYGNIPLPALHAATGLGPDSTSLPELPTLTSHGTLEAVIHKRSTTARTTAPQGPCIQSTADAVTMQVCHSETLGEACTLYGIRVPWREEVLWTCQFHLDHNRFFLLGLPNEFCFISRFQVPSCQFYTHQCRTSTFMPVCRHRVCFLLFVHLY